MKRLALDVAMKAGGQLLVFLAWYAVARTVLDATPTGAAIVALLGVIATCGA